MDEWGADTAHSELDAEETLGEIKEPLTNSPDGKHLIKAAQNLHTRSSKQVYLVTIGCNSCYSTPIW